MTHLRQSPDFPEFTSKTTEVWDKLAGWWDDKIGDGWSSLSWRLKNACHATRP